MKFPSVTEFCHIHVNILNFGVKVKRMKKTEKVIPKVIYIESLKSKKQSRLFPFIFQFMLLYMSLVGFLYCVSTSLNMPMELWRIMLIAFPCLLTSSLFTLSKKLYIPFISVCAHSVTVFMTLSAFAIT